MNDIAPRPAAPVAKPEPLYLTHVEGMRALAAYVVYINHAYAQVWDPSYNQFPPAFLSPFTYSLVAGHLSVTVFIVLSGFCLTLPVANGGDRLRGGTKEFLRRRARRILPPYYAAVALALILIWTIIGKPTGSLWDVPIHVTWVAVISHALLLQDFFATGMINYVFWSIAVEWHIYFLFPLLVLSWRRFGPRYTVAAALLIGYAARIGLAHTRVARASPQYLGLFALGMLAAYVVRSPRPEYTAARQRAPWGLMAAGSFAIACALIGAWGWEVSVDRFPALDFFVGVAAACLLVFTSCRRHSVATRALAIPPLAFIGTFSYSVYLIHAPLLQILWQYVLRPAGLGPVAMFAALMLPGALVILAVSYAFFRAFEKPFIGHGRERNVVRVERAAERLVMP